MIKIQDVMRAGHIKRWNIINTSRQQTLAEHMYNVAMITHHMCTELDINPTNCLQWALVHDIPEVVCGDIPTPTKRRIKERGFDLEDLFEDIDPTYASTKYALTDYERQLVKAADLIESIWFLVENGVGRHSRNVKLGIEERLQFLIDNMVDKRLAHVVKMTYSKVLSGEIYE